MTWVNEMQSNGEMNEDILQICSILTGAFFAKASR